MMNAMELLKSDLKQIEYSKDLWVSSGQTPGNLQSFYGLLTKGTDGNQVISAKLHNNEKQNSPQVVANPERYRLTKPSKLLTKMKSKIYRSALNNSNISNKLALQIRLMREKLGLSQNDLAKELNTSQSAVARLEDMNYGKHSLATLIKISDFFDVSLNIEFASFSKLIRNTTDLSPAALTPISYENEFGQGGEPSLTTELHFDGSAICYQNYLTPTSNTAAFFIK